MFLTSQVPNWQDINITPVFTYLWGLLHDIFNWSQNSYIVFYGNRVSYAELAIFCMVFGYVLMLSPFGTAVNSLDPDGYDTGNDDEMTFVSSSYDWPEF